MYISILQKNILFYTCFCLIIYPILIYTSSGGELVNFPNDILYPIYTRDWDSIIWSTTLYFTIILEYHIIPILIFNWYKNIKPINNYLLKILITLLHIALISYTLKLILNFPLIISKNTNRGSNIIYVYQTLAKRFLRPGYNVTIGFMENNQILHLHGHSIVLNNSLKFNYNWKTRVTSPDITVLCCI